MKIVAGMADAAGVFCEVSMERRMACGVGACLSCVVDTADWQAPRLRGRPGVLCERGGVVMQRKPKETSVNLSVNLGGMAMKNPVTVASGTFGAGMEYHDFVDVAALGAVTTKGVSLNGWEGNASPRIAETASGMLNSIGLQNPGVAALEGHRAAVARRDRRHGHGERLRPQLRRVRGRHRGAWRKPPWPPTR